METITTNLYKAAASGDVAALEEMMQNQKKKMDILALVFYGGNTALHISAFHGRREFVERLLQLVTAQSDEEATNQDQRRRLLRAQNKEGNTALHEAVNGGDDVQIVQKLIAADSTLSVIRNNMGESPFFTASATGRLNALKKLLPITDPLCYTRSDGNTCLHHALFYKKDEVAAELIEKAPELCKSADSIVGNTPLHVAALRGCRKSIVEKLLQCDTSSAFKQEKLKQQTALHLAAQRGHVDVVNCILKFAEDCVEITDKNGKTALHCAVENAQAGVVRCLMLFKRVINIADENGYTALDIANQKYEDEPLSPYFAIRMFLRWRNAMEGVERADQRRETSEPFPSEERYSTTINSLSVCATLIATVTFQAAFTLPPDEKVNRALSTPLSRRAFQSFVLLDWLAFCISIVAAILLAYATFFRRHRSFVVGVSAFILPLALYMMMFSFSLGIFLQLRDEYFMLAAYFYYAMFILAPTTISVVFLVLYNALGYRISEFIRVGLFEITSFGVFKRILRFSWTS